MRKQWVRALGVMVALLVVTAISNGVTWAAASSSTNFQVNEAFFGSGGSLSSCSTTYCSKQSAGELTAGKTGSANYSAFAGFNTTDTPVLELTVTGGTVDVGVLSTTSAASGSTLIKVRNYLSSGYALAITGQAPNQSGRTLAPLASQTASTPGTEQFGINMRANTTPSVGADPVQVPDSSFSYGNYTSGYGTADQYKYVSGDTVAQSTSSSGETDYTMSFIINITNMTPAGLYIANLSAVASATF